MSRRLGAAIALLGLLVGVPLLLLDVTGAPSLSAFPGLKELEESLQLRWIPVEWAIEFLALLAWGLWAYLLLAVLLRAAAHIEARCRPSGSVWAASEMLTWQPVRLLVDLALGAVLLSSTVAHQQAHASGPDIGHQGWGRSIAPQITAIRGETAGGRPIAAGNGQRGTPSPRDTVPREHPRQPRKGYVVRSGDSLWSIAERELDDPYRWQEIWKLNQGRRMPDGARLGRPGFIRPGWVLQLPKRGSSCDREQDDRNDRRAGRQEERTSRRDAHRGPSQDEEPTPSPTTAGSTEVQDGPGRRIELPDGTAVAAGFVAGLVTAIAVARLRRRTQRVPQRPAPGWPRASSALDLKSRLVRSLDQRSGEEAVSAASMQERLQSVAETEPTRILLGHRDGEPVYAVPNGHVYSFTGDEAAISSYLRDLVIHMLVSGPGGREVWLVRGSVPEDFLELAGVRIFDGDRSLISELEIEVIKRHRLFDEEDLGDWDAHRDRWPDDPIPFALALLPPCDQGLRNRAAAVAAQGRDLGLLLMSEGITDATIEITEEGLRPAGPAAQLLGEGLFVPIRLSDSAREESIRGVRAPGEPADEETAVELEVAPAEPVAGPPIRVRLFGPPEVLVAGSEPGEHFGPKVREAFYFFLLHPAGVSRDQVIEALYPEIEPDSGVKRFWYLLGEIRKHLRSDVIPTEKVIEKVGALYRPKVELFDVDVWTFDRMVARAETADDAGKPLVEATRCYGGNLVEGLYYEWAEGPREHFRNRCIDVLVRLAKLHVERGEYQGAVAVLDKALGLDPYAEHVYRQLMALYAHLKRPADVRRIYTELEARLAEDLAVEPAQETADLKDQLVEPLLRK